MQIINRKIIIKCVIRKSCRILKPHKRRKPEKVIIHFMHMRKSTAYM